MFIQVAEEYEGKSFVLYINSLVWIRVYPLGLKEVTIKRE